MDIELEVGQVWANGDKTWTILDLFDEGDSPYVAHKFHDRGVFKDVTYCDKRSFLKDVTLITTADGKPYVKPNDYQDGDVWAHKVGRVTALIKRDGGKIFVITPKSRSWIDIEDTLLNNHPECYELSVRNGKVVTND